MSTHMVQSDTIIDRHAFSLLCLTVAIVLVSQIPQLPWWFSTISALLLAGRWWQRHAYAVTAPVWLKFPLLVILLLGVNWHYGQLLGLAPGAALATGLLVLKTLESERSRDVRVNVAFACFALMTSLLFNQHLVFTLIVVIGLLPALATLRALEPAAPRWRGLPKTLIPGLGLLGAALPLTLLAFVLIPRLSSPLWGTPGTSQSRSTGLSNRMTPTDFTRLLIDNRTAMRVVFDGPPPPPKLRYFRAYVMTYYDGRSWWYDDVRHQPPVPLTVIRRVSYQITLEPTAQRVLPLLDMPIHAPPGMKMHRGRVVMAGKPINKPLRYQARSATKYKLQAQANRPRQRHYLQLPHGFNPRTLKLGRSWRQRHGHHAAAIIQEALTLFHHGGFRYTLAPAPLGRHAIDDFLFQSREGFCEHYASAFTVLMRAAGIPTRVVTGYQGGYWNATAHYLLVRQADAHAWNEVWLTGRGWVRVDPTASVQPQRVTRGAAAAVSDSSLPWSQRNSWLRALRNHWDIINYWWDQGIIAFDTLRQHSLLTSLGMIRVNPALLSLFLMVSFILFGVLGILWALRKGYDRDRARTVLHTLERRLTACGLPRNPGEGPKHYLDRAARALPKQRSTLRALLACYLEMDYIHAKPSAASVQRFRFAVRKFRP